ncbi:MAG TPA: transglutaminase family protein [Puia sp.]|nr:transglutaminase family protein [Puia sp.]
MLYNIKHNTTYFYNESVPLCHNLAMITPRNTNNQSCRSFSLDISPIPEILEEYNDFFGNKVYYFVIEQEHKTLSVTANSIVENKKIHKEKLIPATQSWEEVHEIMQTSNGNLVDEKQYSIPTEITMPDDLIRKYASQSFTPGRSLFEAISELMYRIYTDFKYSSGFTTVSTPLSTVMKEHKGVCQDFAHLGISCLHAMGLSAKYVSGYLETIPAAGEKKLTGADASHAWFSVFIPEMGWVEFDPTNNKIPDEQYIVIGWGRNYFDIIPLRGVITSSNHHQLSVSVDVQRIG